MLDQITIFAENKKGAFQKVTQILADNGAAVDSCITNDGSEYGTIRIICDEPGRISSFFDRREYMCRLTHVIAVEIGDEIARLNGLMIALKEINVNVDYVYTAHLRSSDADAAIMHTEDIEIVENSLRSRGFKLI